MTDCKLHPLAFGLALGIITGISTLSLGILAFIFLNGKPLVSMLGSMYITYNPTLMNSVLSTAIVFIHTVIVGYIAAWIYNLLTKYI